MSLPPAQTPLYNHPLHQLETWLRDQGCTQDEESLHAWSLRCPEWQMMIYLEETALRAEYHFEEDDTRTLTFPYSLTRWDVEQAVFHANPRE
ncbi:DUF3143 domain-containing protein [Candidatus Cyanaurora vandensis]|uniref:DUF3143 domain-containing protein n=1 Tax=Candidatus Cyanaurora vandensis TaxID=2714958 RepID=UPI00257D79BF|nr:DUF3143 domain-containing protein [Candidatus Cyanaurora vandensis]